jgi:hypothetical protein
MRLKKKPGFFVPIPVLAIIAILVGGLLLIRLISGYIPSINAQISNKYLLPGENTPSSINDTGTWLTHTNDKYNYKILYPQILKGVYNYETNNNLILSRERFISNKIDITVTVYSKFETKDLENSTKVGSNTFLYYKNDIDQKGVVVNHNNLFYTIDFSQINYFTETPYFSSSTQFKEIFNLILSNFQFND